MAPWGRIDHCPTLTGRLMPSARVGLLFEGIIRCLYNICLLKIRPNCRSCTHWSKRLRRQIARRSHCWPQLLTGLFILHPQTGTRRGVALA